MTDHLPDLAREECDRAALALVKITHRQALDAARHAVASCYDEAIARPSRDAALAAIDALRGES